MAKELRFLTFDCETATLPFANEIAMDEKQKRNIAIARPLIYDAGWCITNRKGEIIKAVKYLVQETFFVMPVFNTAYYADKRPLYLEMLKRGEISVANWETIAQELAADMDSVDCVGAYNAAFDFFKAIPFTELYVKKIYDPSYYEWERTQRNLCKGIASGRKSNSHNPNYEDPEHFTFRGKTYNLFDIWGLSVKYLINNNTYKRNCFENDLLSESGIYFKTSAETSYRYLNDKYDFNEAHMALDDALIEAEILTKIAKRHKIEMGIAFFPFRELGETVDFLIEAKNVKEAYFVDLIDKMERKIIDYDPTSAFHSRMEHLILRLRDYVDENY